MLAHKFLNASTLGSTLALKLRNSGRVGDFQDGHFAGMRSASRKSASGFAGLLLEEKVVARVFCSHGTNSDTGDSEANSLGQCSSGAFCCSVENRAVSDSRYRLHWFSVHRKSKRIPRQDPHLPFTAGLGVCHLARSNASPWSVQLFLMKVTERHFAAAPMLFFGVALSVSDFSTPARAL
jgi:hypothetical protein